MERSKPVVHPSKLQLFTLRLMIFLGLVCMCFFIIELLGLGTDCMTLYWMLMLTLGFVCLKIIHEWIHYLFITVPETPPYQHKFSVDIFTTFCAGEPYDMIRDTLVAIQAITYPHETYLCDEANDTYLKNLCAELGVHHVTRKTKIDAKAGNINNALKISTGELCLVLDPDHVPYPDMLDPIVSHFNDPAIGFVQVVQSYKNHNQTLIAKGAAQQTYQFYGPMMMTMNKYGTVLAIGANCTFRRAALVSIGGHAAGLAEDMHTAMQLHARGWKSKYVPAVVARGLVPVTLSAYYSQQLKWSRGVFELLVTSYPKLFKKFTWQQKLHYGTIPIFYLSGLFYFINFLIPVVSLLFDTSPVNIDFSNFLQLGLPLAVAIIFIRHFVQKWVMDEEERGFHLVGGLLMIGTWWIYLLGFYYTLSGRVVRYDPTPKDGREENNWPLNIPNLVVIAVSLLSACYGIYNDYNPYNLFMGAFAGMNCLILSFTIAASRQTQFRKYKTGHPVLNVFMVNLALVKKRFWKFRRRLYGWLRQAALILTILVVGIWVYLVAPGKQLNPGNPVIPGHKNILIAGIFSPSAADGLTSIRNVDSISKTSGIHFGIISLYLSWGDQGKTRLPKELIDSIYDRKSIPMITWEPWQSLFRHNAQGKETLKEKKVFSRIVKGEYDQYLERFASQLAALNRPIFIRFAHEFDNPQYPWSTAGGNTAEEFIAAWKYIHNYFVLKKATNVIWVWNPWKPEAVNSYFPGKEYVDWIGVTNLNYADQNPDHKWYDMHEMYEPFHRQSVFNSGIPVMLAEMGSLRSGHKQEEWFAQAFQQISQHYPEIKATVFFNSMADHNVTDPNSARPLDWRAENFKSIAKAFKKRKAYRHWVSNQPLARPVYGIVPERHLNAGFNVGQLHGVSYVKDQNWRINYQNLKKEEISTDFKQMKEIGINTVKHYGPNIYDHNILSVASDKKLKVIYGFWLPEENDYLSDTLKLQRFSDRVLDIVKSLKDNKTIVVWNFGNSPLKQMDEHYYKPDLFYPRQAYLIWLNNLIHSIKKEDPSRPVSVDVDATGAGLSDAQLLHQTIPAIDYLGVITAEGFTGNLDKLPVSYYLTRMSTNAYLNLPRPRPGTVIRNWQDQHTDNFVSFDGLRDVFGHNKQEIYQLADLWNGPVAQPAFPVIRILKPAETLLEGISATYYLMSLVKGNWELTRKNGDLKFIWQLVRKDRFGNGLSMTKLGEGTTVTFQIPAHPSIYMLYVYVVVKGERVRILKSSLNTPLN